MGGFLLIAAGFWVLGPWALSWILGPAYRESLALAKWLVLISACIVPWSVFECYSQARAAEKWLWLTRLVATVAHLATLPALLKWWGVTGVLCSIALSRVAAMVMCAVLLRQSRPEPMRRGQDWPAVGATGPQPADQESVHENP
jgi:O-antigen/teichoic acid export membrane protein